MKVLTVVGARPQFVKAAAVSRVLRQTHDEIMVHTGQHYDDAMSGAFFRDLEMDPPSLSLEVGSGSHAWMTGEIMRRLEPVVAAYQPDWVLVYGDTNSTLAAALVTSKLAPRLAHVEAGVRSYNRQMPEEHNRIVTDHLADLRLAPTATAIGNLSREGLDGQLVGDVMVESFLWAEERALPPQVDGPYILLTLHRPQNVDDPDRLASVIAGLPGQCIVFPVHPRTRAMLSQLPPNVTPIPPVGHLDMVALELHAQAIITDSGGVQKEAYMAGVPCLTLRTETEWPETVVAGWNRLVEPEDIGPALDSVDRSHPRPDLFGDGLASQRIAAALS